MLHAFLNALQQDIGTLSTGDGVGLVGAGLAIGLTVIGAGIGIGRIGCRRGHRPSAPGPRSRRPPSSSPR